MAANIEVILDPRQVSKALDDLNARWKSFQQTGTGAAEKAGQAVDSYAERVVRAAERGRNSIESMTVAIAKQADAFVRHHQIIDATAAALASLGTVALTASKAYVAHASMVDTAANSYRALRFALSPTLFTGATIAAGLLVEELGRMTLAQAKQNEQQILFANSNKLSVDTVQQLSIAVNRVGGNMSTFVDGLKKFQSANPGASIAAFGRELEKLGHISDPTERIQSTLEEFGASVGERLLPHLDERFAINAQRIRDWGVSLSSTARTNMDQFSRDSHDFALGFKEDMDAVGLAAKKMGFSIESGFAAAYVFLKQASGAVFSTPGGPLSSYGAGYEGVNRLFGSGSQTGALFGYERLGQNDISSFVQGLGMAAPRGLDVTGAALQGGMPALDSQFRSLTGTQVRDRELDSQRAIVSRALAAVFPQTDQERKDSAKLTAQDRSLYAQQGVYAQQRIAVLESQKKAEQDAAAAARQAQSTFESIQQAILGYTREAQLAGTSGVQQSSLRRSFALEDLKHQGATRAQLAAADRSLTQPLALEANLQAIAERARRDEFESQLQSEERGRARRLLTNAGEAQFGIGGASAVFAKAVEEMRANVDADRSIASLLAGADRQGLIRQADRAQRMATLQSDQNDPASVQRGYQIQMDLANQLLNVDLRRASVEEDLTKKRVDAAKALADFTEASQTAEIDREMRLLEIDKQRRDEIQRTAAGLYNTLFTKPKDFGKELSSTLKAAALKPVTEGLGEITARTLQPIIYGANGQGGIAGAFHNAFATKQDPLKVSTDINNLVTMQNTVEIARWNSHMEAARAASAGASYGGGSPSSVGTFSIPSAFPVFGEGSSATLSTGLTSALYNPAFSIGPGGTAGFAPGGVGFGDGNPAFSLGPGGTAGFAPGSLGIGGGGHSVGGLIAGSSSGPGGVGGIFKSLNAQFGKAAWANSTSSIGTNFDAYAHPGSYNTSTLSNLSSGPASGTPIAGAITSGGIALAEHGLLGNARGTFSGAVQGAAGGFLIAGPIGAAVGFSIGVGEMLAGVESPLNEAKRLVKQIYNIGISNAVANQIVSIAQSKYGSRVSIAVRSPEVRGLLGLYAAGTGQKFPLSASTPYAGSLVEQGGKLYQQATYQYGNSMAYSSNLPLMGGSGSTQTIPTNGGPTMLTLNVNGQSAADLLDGRVASTVNPGYIQDQYSAAIASGRGLLSNSAMIQQPGLITS